MTDVPTSPEFGVRLVMFGAADTKGARVSMIAIPPSILKMCALASAHLL
jgi:hypothetical protein